ncbi:MAG: purine-nucleoside phosphorylase [Gammaproteobacteria bacterium]|nr:purine-nucleoside phosphorylase [Gammaproteobacteria bacterium]
MQCVEVIRKKDPNFIPKVGIILGSGLGPLADEIENKVAIPYNELPGVPSSTVPGHEGSLILGNLSGVPVVCMKGRIHLYEGVAAHKIKLLIRTIKQLGAHTLILTNAAGSLRKEVIAGEIALITDHINFQHTVPLIGPNDEEFGERFVAMDNAYDKSLRQKLKLVAEKHGVPLHEGVYIAVLGPNFESPAEIRAFKVLGADMVGMSTVPEVIVARHCGLKVVAISTITNLAAGMEDKSLSHDDTLLYAKIGAKKLHKLLKAFLEEYQDELSQ